MDLSQPEVALHIRAAQNAAVRGPHLVLQKRNLDKTYNVRVDNMEEIDPYYDASQQYHFTACLSSKDNDISSIKQDIDMSVQSALDGFNTALMIMSSGVSNNFSDRSKIISHAFTSLNSQIQHLDEYRRKKNEAPMAIEYAYLGVTDDCCYDLRNDRRIKNEVILESGIDSLMKTVNSVEQIWERVKLGSKFPFVLKVRISDNSSILGHFVIVDLLNTRFMANKSQLLDGYTFHDSCMRLRETVKLVATPNYVGLIPTDTCVLTKTLGAYLSGMSRLNAFLYVEEYPEMALEETLIALDFAQHLQRITCRSVRNLVDTRMTEYASKSEYYKERYYKHQATIAELEAKNRDLQMDLVRNKAILQDNFSNESDVKLQIDDLSIKESELKLKNRNLELEVVYLRCHIKTFEGDADEQNRQHQSEQILRKYTQQQALSEIEQLELDLAEKEQRITDLMTALNQKSHQLEELQVFEKQAKILLNESDSKYAKVLRYCERKENEVKEAFKKEQARWYEKRSDMQTKIRNLQAELDDLRARNANSQEKAPEWKSNQEVREVRTLNLPNAATSSKSTQPELIDPNTPVQQVVTVDDITALKRQVQKHTAELERYRAQTQLNDPIIEDGESDNQDRNMQGYFDQPRRSTPEAPVAISDRPASVAQNVSESIEGNISTDAPRSSSAGGRGSKTAEEMVNSPSKRMSDRKHELAVKRAESKEGRRKKPSRTSSTSSNKAKKRSAETMKGKQSTSGINKVFGDNISIMPVELEQRTPGAKYLTSTQQLDQTDANDRSLSPELLVNVKVATVTAPTTVVTNPPATNSLNAIKSLEDVAKSRLPKKKRKLGTRKTEAQVDMPASDVSRYKGLITVSYQY
ncbi:hypothetical protein K450DRAFT_231719 [Umbelopsis ramanniana AG]|uniref:Uncharacterized protein n=1 Tax=Umbelopsis ramanniana AG TaxID=1314678 RepID=A0AAD5HEN5_UMBRA|nr:uncharacterized protein K450DRAFT_231719 [Umbelopsis ramanniana AG]KAI8581522.1 hypothetical protein K450DRAFT_231719 [Umbelopsis ramanniana AG]